MDTRLNHNPPTTTTTRHLTVTIAPGEQALVADRGEGREERFRPVRWNGRLREGCGGEWYDFEGGDKWSERYDEAIEAARRRRG